MKKLIVVLLVVQLFLSACTCATGAISDKWIDSEGKHYVSVQEEKKFVFTGNIVTLHVDTGTYESAVIGHLSTVCGE